MSYETELSVAIMNYYDANTSLVQLAGLLGCRHMEFLEYDGVWRMAHPGQPEVTHESLTADTLRNLLRGDNSNPILLGGLCTRERWRACLKSEEDAYHLVAALLNYALADSQFNPGPLIRQIRDDVHNLMSDWFGVSVGNGGVALPGQIAQALFGDIWWDLVVAPSGALMDAQKLIPLIATTRPAFRPGLLPVQEIIQGQALPELEAAP